MEDSLYTRLGGYDAITMFATNLMAYAANDDILGRFWASRGDDRVDRERQMLINYLVRETGGQMYYTGRDMVLAHQGMRIDEVDWSRFITIVTKVAGELGVGPTEGGEVMAFLESLKSDVLTA